MASSYLELISIVETDLNGRDHPGLEQRTQDTVGYCVGDEMKMERISPEKWKERVLLVGLFHQLFSFSNNKTLSGLQCSVVDRFRQVWSKSISVLI